jgi:hypothetical protein
MPDCSKNLLDQSPREIGECISQELGKISDKLHNWWDALLNTPLSEWFNAIGIAVLLPALLASYILPFLFLGQVAMRISGQYTLTFNGNERILQRFWGIYLVLGGLFIFLIDPLDTFVILQGAWQAVIGVLILLFDKKWWGKYLYSEG